MKTVTLLAASAACAVISNAFAGLVSSQSIGTGSSSATLQFDFENGNSHLVTVRFDGSLTGFGALELVAAQATGGQLDYLSFSFGKFVTGLGVGGDYQYGEGELWPVENYWHYWTAEGAAAFAESWTGAADRALQDGSRDAWVFGSSAAPAAVPAPGAMALVFAAGVRRRRR